MTSESSITDTTPKRQWPKRLSLTLVLIAIICVVYIRTHPLVFNESFFSHAHCITQVGLSFLMYAKDHGGAFPFHTNGYGDALVLLMVHGDSPSALTGPGYDSAGFMRAISNRYDIPEAECGRVYVQGLGETNNPDIVIFFDKLPTPGGDHCHLLRRLLSPLGREVWTIGSDQRFIKEREWPESAKNQIELLVKDGFDRATAEKLYAEKGRRP